MTNFVAIVDPNIERRSNFVKKIEPLLPPIDGLNTDTCATGRFCAIWASQYQAPVSYIADQQGGAVIWGDAINGKGPERITSTQLRHLWNDLPTHVPDALDGFHAAIVYNLNDHSVTVGADLLGIFPIYYYITKDILLVGSSPELFKHHPTFRMEFNPAGLVGILLTNGLVDGHTLLQDVRRLAAGHLLVWYPEKGADEVKQYQLPISNRYINLPFSVHLDIMDQAVNEAITRHLPPDRGYGQLLSGGLDSRMLAGYLKQKGIDVVTLTLGIPTDLEMKCAIPVARTLGFEYQTATVPFDQYPFFAGLQARWEHLANGFSSIMNWGVCEHLKKIASHFASAYVMDPILGGSHLMWPYSPSDHSMSFESFFARVNRWGIQPQDLKKLLRHEMFDGLINATINRLGEIYESYSDLEFQRAWGFDLHHRERFHTGFALWRYSFGAWPVVPVIDKNILETVGGMPPSTLANRRAQNELFCKRFPQLARLPLDRNSYNIEPLRPRYRRLIAKSLSRRLGLHRLQRFIDNQRGERRYYPRIYDFNGPGWLAVRQEVEPYRERVLHLFNKDMLDDLLPPPDVHIPYNSKVPAESSGMKLLLGFLLWSKDHLL